MRNLIIFIFIILFCEKSILLAQSEELRGNSIEIFLIDAYVKPELPHKFFLSFFTSDSCKSKVIISGKDEFIVSDTFMDDHRIEIPLAGISFDSTTAPFIIYVTAKDGIVSKSEKYDLLLPLNNQIVFNNAPGLFEVCCFGGIIFGLPSPTYLFTNGDSYFSLTKEIPLFSFYGVGYNYPAGYFGIEYAYVFNADVQHYIRTGYKHIFQLPVLEYISPGIGFYTDLNGHNGLSAEISIGLIKIYNTFTLFSKYRYNIQSNGSYNNFHEISLGLYSNFFSFNL